MNFFQLLSEIEKVDPEVYDRLDSRRRVFKHMAGVGQKLSAAALPMFVGAVLNKAYAQTPTIDVNGVLNLALKLEYLEAAFYQARAGILSQLGTANQNALALIAADEANHVKFLQGVLGSAATPQPTAATTFDFTAKGNFPDAPTNAATYLAVAEALEDFGVRAYKGAAPLPAIVANKTALTAALNIHSIEARHASRIRSMRRGGLTNNTPASSVAVAPYSTQPKSWISGADGGGPAPGKTDFVYGAGNNTGAPSGVTFEVESNVAQGGVTLSTSTSANFANFPASAFSEAFDEGLDATTVISNANRLFSLSGTYFNA